MIESSWRSDNRVTIRGPLHRHLARSLRSRPGDPILFVDETGLRYHARVEQVEPSTLQATIERIEPPLAPSPCRITLAVGIPKADRMEWILEKATELGVEGFVPLISARTLWRGPEQALGKLPRWKAIVREATQQSGRGACPEVESPLLFDHFISGRPGGGVLLWEQERSRSLAAALKDLPGQRITLVIGPEGGWTESEAQLAASRGFLAAGLGPRTLRTETAAVAAVVICQAIHGDIG